MLCRLSNPENLQSPAPDGNVGWADMIGTGFLCNSKGYILTAAHNVTLGDTIGFSVTDDVNAFNPERKFKLRFFRATVVQHDALNDVALLQSLDDLDYLSADYDSILGHEDSVPVGSSLCYMGYPYSHMFQHSIKISGCVLSSKILTTSGSRRLMLDTLVEIGNSGGPVFDVASEKIIGIVVGRFKPAQMQGSVVIGEHELGTISSISYASAISNGLELLKAQGV